MQMWSKHAGLCGSKKRFMEHCERERRQQSWMDQTFNAIMKAVSVHYVLVITRTQQFATPHTHTHTHTHFCAVRFHESQRLPRLPFWSWILESASRCQPSASARVTGAAALCSAPCHLLHIRILQLGEVRVCMCVVCRKFVCVCARKEHSQPIFLHKTHTHNNNRCSFCKRKLTQLQSVSSDPTRQTRHKLCDRCVRIFAHTPVCMYVCM
jgi:hypothetical protein